MGSDGLFDNIFKEEILLVLNERMPKIKNLSK